MDCVTVTFSSYYFNQVVPHLRLPGKSATTSFLPCPLLARSGKFIPGPFGRGGCSVWNRAWLQGHPFQSCLRDRFRKCPQRSDPVETQQACPPEAERKGETGFSRKTLLPLRFHFRFRICRKATEDAQSKGDARGALRSQVKRQPLLTEQRLLLDSRGSALEVSLKATSWG